MILDILLLILFALTSGGWLLEQRVGIINAKTFQRTLELQDERIKYYMDYMDYVKMLESEIKLLETKLGKSEEK